MSNPLTRTPEPPESALSVCAGFEFLAYETLVAMAQDLPVQCMTSAILSGKGSDVLRFTQPISLTMSTCMELLPSALQANDQPMALDLTRRIFSHPERQGSSDAPPWPRLAIWAAVWLNMEDVVRILLDNGVGVEMDQKVETRIKFWPSVLYLASILDHTSIVETLLARGAISKAPKPETKYHGSFQIAAAQGHIGVVQKYMAHDVSCINEKFGSRTAVGAASKHGAWHCVTALIAAGADVNELSERSSEKWTPLSDACYEGYTKTAEALLAGGADADALGPYEEETALWFPTADVPNIACVRTLLKYNANPNHRHFKPPLMIQIAEMNHDSEIIIPVCDALRQGIRSIDINTTNDAGETALLIASFYGNLGLVVWLLANGADPDVLDRKNKSALFHAISKNHVDTVAALLNKGARVDVAHNAGKDPLLFLALRNPEMVRLLVEAGADVNLANSAGTAPINLATAHGDREVVEKLIDKGADINYEESNGWRPIFIAVYVASYMMRKQNKRTNMAVPQRSLSECRPHSTPGRKGCKYGRQSRRQIAFAYGA